MADDRIPEQRLAAEAAIAREHDARLAVERTAQERTEALERRMEALERSAQENAARFDEERAARLAAERRFDEAQERIEALERAQARAAQIIEEANAQIQAANDAKMAAERLAQEKASRVQGKYYSTISQVWGTRSVTVNKGSFGFLYRTNCPSKYKETVTAASDTHNVAADESTASRSFKKGNKETWPVDIFGNVHTTADVAHLIPAAPSYSFMYDHVAAWVTGVKFQPNDRNFWKKVIHGSRREAGAKRENLSGLKHSDWNMIRLNCQSQIMDKNPCVVIIPVMPRRTMLDWDGESYSAIVMVDSWGSVSSSNACHDIGMAYLPEGKIDELATTLDINMARNRLQDALSALAESLKRRDSQFHDAVQQHGHTLFNVLGEVIVPTEKKPGNHAVKKIFFGTDTNDHPPPDPILLTVKSALVYAQRHGQKLLATGEKDEDDDDNSSIETVEEVPVERHEQSPEQSCDQNARRNEVAGAAWGQQWYHHSTGDIGIPACIEMSLSIGASQPSTTM